MDPAPYGWQPIADLAASNHGIVTRDQLAEAGASRRQVSTWVQAGRLVSVGRGAYIVGGAPITFPARVLGLVAVHGPETWASRRTAGALWGIDGYPEDHRIELLRPSDGSNARRGAIVHRSTLIPAEHVTIHRGVPVTTPERTIMDLAGCIGPLRLRSTVAAAVRSGLCSDASLQVVLARMAGRGRPGTRRLRDVLSARTALRPGHSDLEALARAVVLAAGLPEPDWEVDMSDEQGWIGRVDGVFRPERVVVELDSERWHGQDVDRLHDAGRDRRIQALGYVVLRVTWADLVDRPDSVVAQIRALLAARAPAA